ncbi:hypothetical protein ACOJCM_08750 [Billgrantia sp. LNSP4103-1]|uniref:hypothetical protein n=1 Tax=Billgrantia sp. LNSP4103-1 TaxID=3410266 RepID=UPI00403F1E7E
MTKEIPAKLDNKLENEMKDLSKTIYERMGIDSVARVDLIVDSYNRINVLEVNTLPGLMPQSVVPAVFDKQGMCYDHLIEMILMRSFLPKRFNSIKLYDKQPELSNDVVM